MGFDRGTLRYSYIRQSVSPVLGFFGNTANLRNGRLETLNDTYLPSLYLKIGPVQLYVMKHAPAKTLSCGLLPQNGDNNASCTYVVWLHKYLRDGMVWHDNEA